MGTRTTKKTRRLIKRNTKEIVKRTINEIRDYSFRERLKFAWFIIKGR